VSKALPCMLFLDVRHSVWLSNIRSVSGQSLSSGLVLQYRGMRRRKPRLVSGS
jgi:hypothetical protein